MKAIDVIEEIPYLPMDYYDNDDGFWNDFIKDKHS